MFCKIILINGCFYCYCYYYMQDYLQTTINSEPTPTEKPYYGSTIPMGGVVDLLKSSIPSWVITPKLVGLHQTVWARIEGIRTWRQTDGRNNKGVASARKMCIYRHGQTAHRWQELDSSHLTICSFWIICLVIRTWPQVFIISRSKATNSIANKTDDKCWHSEHDDCNPRTLCEDRLTASDTNMRNFINIIVNTYIQNSRVIRKARSPLSWLPSHPRDVIKRK